MGSEGQPVIPFDWHRMLIGDVPWLFTLEIVLRTLLMYGYTLGLIRLLGKRAVGQLSMIEFLLVIALGSSVGDPMFYDDVPILHGMVVITVVVLFNRGLFYVTSRNETIEVVLDGAPRRLVRDGVLDRQGMKRALLDQEKLFELLREGGVVHLGQVRAAYLEQNGHLSLFRHKSERAGLRIEPPWDIERPESYAAGSTDHPGGALGCMGCGEVHEYAPSELLPKCADCDCDQWTDAVEGHPAATPPAA